MNIGYDAKRLFNNKTGLGSYSRNLIRCMTEYYPSESYHLYTPSVTLPAYASEFDQLENVSIYKADTINKAMWRTYGVSKHIRNNKTDIYHGLTHELPRNINDINCAKVVTIHDLIFKRFPEYFPAFDRTIYNLKWKHAINAADKIIAISQHTKSDIIEFYDVNPDKIDVIYNICDRRFYNPTEISSDSYQLDLPANFMLSVGSIEPRKNFASVLNAMAQIPDDQRISYVIVGRGKEKHKKKLQNLIHSLGLEHVVHIKSNITNDQILEVYQRAEFLVYPSHYEGHGLPITEALLCGTPVLSSFTSSMREAGGPDCLYFDPIKIEDIKSAIIKIQDDTALRKSISMKGKEYALNISDRRKITTQTIELYRRLKS